MVKSFFLAFVMSGIYFLVNCSLAQAADVTAADLKPALEQLLHEHPEVVLNFLREHSKTILDIAQQGSNERRQENMEKQWQSDSKVKKEVSTQGRPFVGNPDAKVRIVAFSDFTCQFCQRAEKMLEELLKEYEGRVSFVFKNMPLDPKGISGLASQYFVAISMQSEELAWKFYKELFENRDKLLAEGEAFLRSTATTLGVDMRQLDRKRRQKAVSAILDEDLKDADKLHIEGTPYFLVNNLVIRGAVSKELFRRAIEMELNVNK